MVEIARINLRERNIFPYEEYEVRVWSDGLIPPHFHVKSGGWDVTFSIETGKELEVLESGEDPAVYHYISTHVNEWLDGRCALIPKITNRENAMGQWVQLHEEYYWVEISKPLEKWFREENGRPISSEMAHRLLRKGKKEIQELGDGVHYEQEMGEDKVPVAKCIYEFSSECTYKNALKKLEEDTGFKSLEGLQPQENALPVMSEELDYEDNHPDKVISTAMETIIQIGNAWDDGLRELSPNMKAYLKAALDTLQACDDKNQQIRALIRNGSYYDENMVVLECHRETDPFLFLNA